MSAQYNSSLEPLLLLQAPEICPYAKLFTEPKASVQEDQLEEEKVSY